MKQFLSDFVSLMFGEPEKSDTHSWSVIIGIMAFLIFIFVMLSIAL